MEGNFTLALREVASCGAYDALVLCLDANDGQAVDYEGQDDAVNRILTAAQATHRLPFFLMSTRHGVLGTAQARVLRDAGIASIGGMAQGLGALGRVARWMAGSAAPEALAPRRVAPPAWAERASVNEFDAKRLLAGDGLAAMRERLVESAADAAAAAREIGYPVAMKAVDDALLHRSEHGLVELRLADADAVAAAWRRLARRLDAMGPQAQGARILVQEMARPASRSSRASRADPSFGLVMALGPGGVLAELVDDVAMCLLPLRDGDVAALMSGPRLARLLAGFRGAPADTDALAAALRGLAGFAVTHAPWIEGIDVNPLIVHDRGEGCSMVDALIVPRGGAGSPEHGLGAVGLPLTGGRPASPVRGSAGPDAYAPRGGQDRRKVTSEATSAKHLPVLVASGDASTFADAQGQGRRQGCSRNFCESCDERSDIDLNVDGLSRRVTQTSTT